MEKPFENSQTAFVAALIRGDLDAAADLMRGVTHQLQARTRLAEAEQKKVNQILVAAKNLGSRYGENATAKLQPTRVKLKSALAQVVRAEVRDIDYVAYAAWRQNLPGDEALYRSILPNVASLQLSVGCSNFCRRCNEWALAGVRRHFDFDAARRIVQDLSGAGNDHYALYCASDPLDYQCSDRTIADLLRYMQQQGYHTRFGLLTKVPRGSEALARQLLAEGVDISVSLTEKNRGRIARIEAELGKTFHAHHDTAELLIPAGLDEDFATIKSSVTDNYGIEFTPEAAWMVIPTFTSALNPTGQCRLPIGPQPDWILRKRVGREALMVEYFKPLAVCDLDGRKFVLDYLLGPQIENVLLDNGDQDLTPPGMMNLAEYFKTFDPDIVHHRQQLAAAAIENLHQRIFQEKNIAGRDQQALELEFDRRKQAYLDFCDPEKVQGYKRRVFAFLLSAAAPYLDTHPDGLEIIRFLRRNDTEILEEYRGASVEMLVAGTKLGAFDSFTCLVHRMLTDPGDGQLATFLDSTPSAYNPELDRFE
ncbi:MAG: hypothetical protein [Olavius algarvensis Delta 4 endosymbiont]|nr:MAG: hypothetical protein [Olavius algarvensis Delta 4 endosymbiont]